MAASNVSAGYFRGGLPYNRLGHGPRIAVIFQGLLFENKPLTGLAARGLTGMYRFLAGEYTAYIVTRKPGLPHGYSLQNMADDYAEMIREEFGGQVDSDTVSVTGRDLPLDISTRSRYRHIICEYGHTVTNVRKACSLPIYAGGAPYVLHALTLHMWQQLTGQRSLPRENYHEHRVRLRNDAWRHVRRGGPAGERRAESRGLRRSE